MIETTMGFLTGDPPTSAEIKAAREAIEARRRARKDRALTAFMLVPIPGLDILASLATSAVEEARSGDDGALARALEWDKAASFRDWAETDTTAAYAAKVKAAGRLLIRAETAALETHIRSVKDAKATGEALINAAGDVFKSWLK
jgi:hypothetical protein